MVNIEFVEDFSVEVLEFFEEVAIETVNDLLAIEEPKWCGVVCDDSGVHYSSYQAASFDGVDEYNSSEVYSIQNGELVSSLMFGEEAQGVNELMIGFKELTEIFPGIKNMVINNLYKEEDPGLAIEIEIKRLAAVEIDIQK